MITAKFVFTLSFGENYEFKAKKKVFCLVF